MKSAVACIIALCFANVSCARVLNEDRSNVCAFYIDAPFLLSSNEEAKTVFLAAVKNLTGLDDIRINPGTNDVALFVSTLDDAIDACHDLSELKLPEDVFGSAKILKLVTDSKAAVTTRKCTYTGACKWWWAGCSLYRTCGKGYVSGGVNGAGDLYGKACTSSCRTKCYSYCQCVNDNSCYGK